jgi:transcription elongation GreA/GreB family factor
MQDEALPERPLSEHPNYVTPAGLRQLEKKLGALEGRRLKSLAGDDEALEGEEPALIDRDVHYFARLLRSAILVDLAKQPRRKVAFGAAVTVSEEDGTQRTFRIVGEDEADLAEGKISYVSPLAAVLLEGRVGAGVLWRRPAGDKRLTIEAIDYPTD